MNLEYYTAWMTFIKMYREAAQYLYSVTRHCWWTKATLQCLQRLLDFLQPTQFRMRSYCWIGVYITAIVISQYQSSTKHYSGHPWLLWVFDNLMDCFIPNTDPWEERGKITDRWWAYFEHYKAFVNVPTSGSVKKMNEMHVSTIQSSENIEHWYRLKESTLIRRFYLSENKLLNHRFRVYFN